MREKKTKLLRGASERGSKRKQSNAALIVKRQKVEPQKQKESPKQAHVDVISTSGKPKPIPNKVLGQDELEKYLAENSSQEILFEDKEFDNQIITVEDFNLSQSDDGVRSRDTADNDVAINSANATISDTQVEENIETESTPHFTFAAQTPERTKKRQLRKSKSTMLSPKGRKQGIVWDKFKTVRSEETGEITSNKCNACFQEVSAQKCRMEKHLLKCRINCSAGRDNSATENCSSKVVVKASEIDFPDYTEVKTKMKKWVDTIAPKEKNDLDLKVARFIYGSNLSFRTVSSPLFKEIFLHLKPSYELPSPKVIGSSLLEKVYCEANAAIKEDLIGKKVTILQDGWSTNQNSPVISHCLHDGTRSFYLDAVEPKMESKTADYCFGLLKDAMKKARDLYRCDIIGFGTDNAETMNCLREKCSLEFRDIHVYGCQSHIFNLLANDVTPKSLTEEIVSVQKFFRNHHFESSALKEMGGLRPVLPNATRWNSQLDCMKNFQKNQAKYLEISRMPKCHLSQNSPIYLAITDVSIYERISAVVNLLEPIATALDACQSDTASLADAIYHWLEIQKKWPVLQIHTFNRRKEMGVTPTGIAAYLLHPIYRGKNLSTEETETGRKFLERQSPFLVAATISLNLSDESFYSKSYLNVEMIKHLTPALWWKGLSNHKSITPNMSSFAESLMLLPASTAAIERCFSTMRDILTNKRNRLSVEKAQKLCSIYRSLVLKYDLSDDDENEVESVQN